MKLTIDFETRATIDLKKVGAAVYSRHPETEIMCLSVKVDDKPSRIWVPKKFRLIIKDLLGPGWNTTPRITQEAMGAALTLWKNMPKITLKKIKRLLLEAEQIHAHNASFELAMWHKMETVYKVPCPPLERWYCTAAKAASYALPRALGAAGEALGLGITKDTGGHALMLQMCKPRRPSKFRPERWNELGPDLIHLAKYCLQDTEAEYAISQALPRMPNAERAMWLLDHRINTRGVYCRTKMVQRIVNAIKIYETELLQEMSRLTDGQVQSPRQVFATRAWLSRHGAEIENLQKETIAQAVLKGVGDTKAKKVLDIRQALSRSSTAKYGALLDWAGSDSRIRGMLLFDGAERTGRWAGRGPQPHNLPRPKKEHTLEVIGQQVVKLVSIPALKFKETYGCPMALASSAIRSMFSAPPGHDFLCADFAAVEARVLAWLAGENKVLKAFRGDKDLYKVAATQIYGVKYKDVDSEQRQIGKVAVLALGYQGGPGAFQSMASSYGVSLAEEAIKDIVKAWRAGHPAITRYWHLTEKAALLAMRNPKRAFKSGRIIFARKGRFLFLRLPSGRRLAYFDPMIQKITTDWGQTKAALTYMGVASLSRKWVRLTTYGGKLVENITQAVARDLLRDALLRVEKKGFKPIFHVHDEIITEVPEDTSEKSLNRFCKIMAKVPVWAEGMPLAAKGWRGKCYRK